MPQSLSSVIVHVIFSTKDRTPNLAPDFRPDVHAYLAEVARTHRCECYRAGGVADHVHLAIRLARTITVADLVKELKTNSTKWVKTQSPRLRDFAWQGGYGAFSIHHRDLAMVLDYIHRQDEHHRKKTFKEEYLDFLTEYGIKCDEKYLWD